MELIRKSFSSIFGTKLDNSVKESFFFIETGSKLLKKLIVQSDGRSMIPLRNFSSKELAQATNNFDFDGIVNKDCDYMIYRGSLEERQILVKKYGSHYGWGHTIESFFVRNIVISSHMSFHKNVIKLIGYCLDYESPALVYQSPEACVCLSHHLLNTNLTWESKLSMALDIAHVLAYLHTAFQTPIIHRYVKLGDVVIDKHGTAKLTDFSYCISIPLGECHVTDSVVGYYEYADPEYVATGILTEKSDVYSFGVLLIELLTQKLRFYSQYSENSISFLDTLRSTDEVEVRANDDMVMEEEANGDMVMEGETRHFRAFATLALKCTREERESRPDMVDVAKELRRIQRSVCSSSAP